MAPLRRPLCVTSSMSWTMLAITFMTYWLVIVHQGYQSALMIYKKMLKAHYKSASNTGTLEPCGEISRPSWRNMFQLDQLETSEKDLSGCCVLSQFSFSCLEPETCFSSASPTLTSPSMHWCLTWIMSSHAHLLPYHSACLAFPRSQVVTICLHRLQTCATSVPLFISLFCPFFMNTWHVFLLRAC